ncbi:MAG: acyl-homoserine-lactone synthase [Emcibacteraceae bacterium]
MIHLINKTNRNAYTDILSQMYKQRTAVFIDRLRWDLNCEGGEEIDQFDTDDTIYLVCIDDDSGKIMSSIRLNPTCKPHLMSEIFNDLCSEGVPTGPTIFEGSRYCYNPELISRTDRLEAMRYMICGVMECAVMHGWDKITFVINMPLLAHCLRAGWQIYPLGIPQYKNKLAVGAFAIDVTQEDLKKVRENMGLSPAQSILVPDYYDVA